MFKRFKPLERKIASNMLVLMAIWAGIAYFNQTRNTQIDRHQHQEMTQK